MLFCLGTSLPLLHALIDGFLKIVDIAFNFCSEIALAIGSKKLASLFFMVSFDISLIRNVFSASILAEILYAYLTLI